MDEIEDFYENGRFLRKWSLVDGRAVCLEDAVEVSGLSKQEIADILEQNDAVREAVAATATAES